LVYQLLLGGLAARLVERALLRIQMKVYLAETGGVRRWAAVGSMALRVVLKPLVVGYRQCFHLKGVDLKDQISITVFSQLVFERRQEVVDLF